MCASIIFISSPTDLILPLLTAITIIILYRQYKINKDKLRLDLFNRRYSVYSKLIDCFNRVLINHKITDQDVFNITAVKEEAYFLFDKDKDIYDFLSECHTKLSKLNQYEKAQLMKMQLRNMPAPTDPLAPTKEYKQLEDAVKTYTWIRIKLEELKEIFGKYLHF